MSIGSDGDARLAGLCAGDGLAGLLATRWANFARASSYLRSLPFVTGSRVAALVDGSTGALSGLVLPRIEAASLTDYEYSDDVNIVLYGDFHFAFADELRLGERDQAVRRLLDRAVHEPTFSAGVQRVARLAGIHGMPVGCDDVNVVADLSEDVPELDLRDARSTWMRIRRVKTPTEIEHLRRSASITETIERELFAMCKPGASATELRHAYECRAAELGGVPGFWSTGMGPHAPLILDSSPRALEHGDLVRFDFGCTYRGYWSDTGRTVSLGEPTPGTISAYNALRAGIQAGFDALRPGVALSELFDKVMATIRGSGLPQYQRHHVGHSIGAEMYDADFVAPRYNEPVEAGMVLNLEVPLYQVGGIALQIEDTALVTPDGYELLTTNSRDIVVN